MEKLFIYPKVIIFGLILMLSCIPENEEQLEEIISSKEEPVKITPKTTNARTTASNEVLMQAFYWDCFNESGNGNWWDFVRPNLDELAAAGITEIWLPPVQKSQHNPSMGYDPYDYYDLGEYDQKNTIETYFGSRTELENLITTAHNNGLKVFADLVYNHNSGGDLEYNPNTGTETYTSFTPLSGVYQFNYDNFHPSSYEESDPGTFGDFPDLAHANPNTYSVIENYTLWLKNTIGFDGWRYDYVKGLHPWVVESLQTNVGGYGVGEFWDGNKDLVLQWLADINYTAGAFDFPLFYNLKDMCNDNKRGAYDMRNLWTAGIVHDVPELAVTFVENHDTDKNDPVVHDKMMAYSYILTHEGLPTVFWKDYYNYSLARTGQPNGIDQLLWVRHNLADGTSSLLHSSNDLYVMQRNGTPGLILVLNDNTRNWGGATVTTKWANTTLKAYAWNSEIDSGTPNNVTTDGNGQATLNAPPRGYVIYAPEASSGGDGSDDTTAPAAPANLSATAASNANCRSNIRIELDWDDNTESDFASYNVYRDNTLLASEVTSSSYTDSQVAKGTTYTYVVTAVDTSNNESANSNQASATTCQ